MEGLAACTGGGAPTGRRVAPPASVRQLAMSHLADLHREVERLRARAAHLESQLSAAPAAAAQKAQDLASPHVALVVEHFEALSRRADALAEHAVRWEEELDAAIRLMPLMSESPHAPVGVEETAHGQFGATAEIHKGNITMQAPPAMSVTPIRLLKRLGDPTSTSIDRTIPIASFSSPPDAIRGIVAKMAFQKAGASKDLQQPSHMPNNGHPEGHLGIAPPTIPDASESIRASSLTSTTDLECTVRLHGMDASRACSGTGNAAAVESLSHSQHPVCEDSPAGQNLGPPGIPSSAEAKALKVRAEAAEMLVETLRLREAEVVEEARVSARAEMMAELADTTNRSVTEEASRNARSKVQAESMAEARTQAEQLSWEQVQLARESPEAGLVVQQDAHLTAADVTGAEPPCKPELEALVAQLAHAHRLLRRERAATRIRAGLRKFQAHRHAHRRASDTVRKRYNHDGQQESAEPMLISKAHRTDALEAIPVSGSLQSAGVASPRSDADSLAVEQRETSLLVAASPVVANSSPGSCQSLQPKSKIQSSVVPSTISITTPASATLSTRTRPLSRGKFSDKMTLHAKATEHTADSDSVGSARLLVDASEALQDGCRADTLVQAQRSGQGTTTPASSTTSRGDAKSQDSLISFSSAEQERANADSTAERAHARLQRAVDAAAQELLTGSLGSGLDEGQAHLVSEVKRIIDVSEDDSTEGVDETVASVNAEDCEDARAVVKFTRLPMESLLAARAEAEAAMARAAAAEAACVSYQRLAAEAEARVLAIESAAAAKVAAAEADAQSARAEAADARVMSHRASLSVELSNARAVQAETTASESLAEVERLRADLKTALTKVEMATAEARAFEIEAADATAREVATISSFEVEISAAERMAARDAEALQELRAQVRESQELKRAAEYREHAANETLEQHRIDVDAALAKVTKEETLRKLAEERLADAMVKAADAEGALEASGSLVKIVAAEAYGVGAKVAAAAHLRAEEAEAKKTLARKEAIQAIAAAEEQHRCALAAAVERAVEAEAGAVSARAEAAAAMSLVEATEARAREAEAAASAAIKRSQQAETQAETLVATALADLEAATFRAEEAERTAARTALEAAVMRNEMEQVTIRAAAEGKIAAAASATVDQAHDTIHALVHEANNARQQASKAKVSEKSALSKAATVMAEAAVAHQVWRASLADVEADIETGSLRETSHDGKMAAAKSMAANVSRISFDDAEWQNNPLVIAVDEDRRGMQERTGVFTLEEIRLRGALALERAAYEAEAQLSRDLADELAGSEARLAAATATTIRLANISAASFREGLHLSARLAHVHMKLTKIHHWQGLPAISATSLILRRLAAFRIQVAVRQMLAQKHARGLEDVDSAGTHRSLSSDDEKMLLLSTVAAVQRSWATAQATAEEAVAAAVAAADAHAKSAKAAHARCASAEAQAVEAEARAAEAATRAAEADSRAVTATAQKMAIEGAVADAADRANAWAAEARARCEAAETRAAAVEARQTMEMRKLRAKLATAVAEAHEARRDAAEARAHTSTARAEAAAVASTATTAQEAAVAAMAEARMSDSILGEALARVEALEAELVATEAQLAEIEAEADATAAEYTRERVRSTIDISVEVLAYELSEMERMVEAGCRSMWSAHNCPGNWTVQREARESSVESPLAICSMTTTEQPRSSKAWPGALARDETPAMAHTPVASGADVSAAVLKGDRRPMAELTNQSYCPLYESSSAQSAQRTSRMRAHVEDALPRMGAYVLVPRAVVAGADAFDTRGVPSDEGVIRREDVSLSQPIGPSDRDLLVDRADGASRKAHASTGTHGDSHSGTEVTVEVDPVLPLRPTAEGEAQTNTTRPAEVPTTPLHERMGSTNDSAELYGAADLRRLLHQAAAATPREVARALRTIAVAAAPRSVAVEQGHLSRISTGHSAMVAVAERVDDEAVTDGRLINRHRRDHLINVDQSRESLAMLPTGDDFSSYATSHRGRRRNASTMTDRPIEPSAREQAPSTSSPTALDGSGDLRVAADLGLQRNHTRPHLEDSRPHLEATSNRDASRCLMSEGGDNRAGVQASELAGQSRQQLPASVGQDHEAHDNIPHEGSQGSCELADSTGQLGTRTDSSQEPEWLRLAFSDLKRLPSFEGGARQGLTPPAADTLTSAPSDPKITPATFTTPPRTSAPSPPHVHHVPHATTAFARRPPTPASKVAAASIAERDALAARAASLAVELLREREEGRAMSAKLAIARSEADAVTAILDTKVSTAEEAGAAEAEKARAEVAALHAELHAVKLELECVRRRADAEGRRAEFHLRVVQSSRRQSRHSSYRTSPNYAGPHHLDHTPSQVARASAANSARLTVCDVLPRMRYGLTPTRLFTSTESSSEESLLDQVGHGIGPEEVGAPLSKTETASTMDEYGTPSTSESEQHPGQSAASDAHAATPHNLNGTACEAVSVGGPT